MPDVDWRQSVSPLADLPEDVLAAILHFLYAECLPNNLSEVCAQQVISAVSRISSDTLLKLASLCEQYLKRLTLKKGKVIW